MRASTRKRRSVNELNRMLSTAGLATLDNPTDLLNQLAHGIENHDDFRRLLFKIDPEQRANCYKSLAHRLSFIPKALDVYEMEAKQEAERKRAPRLDEKTGILYEFEPARTARPNEADPSKYNPMTWNGKHQRLTLTCFKCTKQAQFCGDTPIDAATKARKALWIHEAGREICPECPAVRTA